MNVTLTKVLFAVFFIYNIDSVFAQLTDKNKSNLYLNTFIGYGTENNWGNTAFFGGATLSKPINKHLFLEGGLTRFTTDIYNVYKAKPTSINNEDRKYNAWFLTTNANYTFGKKQSFLNASIKIGPSLKYYNYRVFGGALIRVYPDGRKEAVEGTLKYNDKNGFNISLYNSVSFDVKVTSKLRVGVFLDTYSHDIPIEHFMPGINAVFKL